MFGCGHRPFPSHDARSCELRWQRDRPTERGLVALRERYNLAAVIDPSRSDYDNLRKLTAWVNARWDHDGSGTPTRSDPLTILREAEAGESFACFAFAIALAGVAEAVGMPSRVVYLAGDNADDPAVIARQGFGHVVTEVWLADRSRWAVADAQLGYTFTRASEPIGVIELIAALDARRSSTVHIDRAVRAVSDRERADYVAFLAMFVAYASAYEDQRRFVDDTGKPRMRNLLSFRGSANLPKRFVEKPTQLTTDVACFNTPPHPQPKVILASLRQKTGNTQLSETCPKRRLRTLRPMSARTPDDASGRRTYSTLSPEISEWR
ncbi:MAG: transglutaminase family protein [Kofleriaceae bacterium]